MVKLKYSRYNEKIKYEWVCKNTYSSDLLCYANRSHEGFVEFCVIKFQVLGYLMMDKGIRSKKSLSLGMPMASQAITKREASN